MQPHSSSIMILADACRRALLADAERARPKVPRGRRGRAAGPRAMVDEPAGALQPGHRPNPRYRDPAFRMAFARLVTHYWRHAAWLEDGVLQREAKTLAGIPVVLVQGRLDVRGHPDIAWELAQTWSDSEFVLVDEAGHGSATPA